MIHYVFFEAEGGHVVCAATSWPVYRQLVAECSADPQEVRVTPYDDAGFPVGPEVTL